MFGLMVWAAAAENLGHNLMDHHLGVGAGGLVEGYDDKYYYGRRANWNLYSTLQKFFW